jgi:hypothetical protein
MIGQHDVPAVLSVVPLRQEGFSAGLKGTVSRKICVSVGKYFRAQHIPASGQDANLS